MADQPVCELWLQGIPGRMRLVAIQSWRLATA
jgi:hypothetical protein